MAAAALLASVFFGIFFIWYPNHGEVVVDRIALFWKTEIFMNVICKDCSIDQEVSKGAECGYWQTEKAYTLLFEECE